MKKIVTRNLINTLSKLAKINLTKKQEEKYVGEFSAVMGYMEEIKNINVDDVQETSRITKEENVLRKDVVKQSLDQKEALKNSKNTSNGYFLVPAIFKED